MSTRWHDQILTDHPRVARLTAEQTLSVFDKRGIAPKIWLGRAYVPYDAGDWESVLQAEPLYATLAAGRQRYLQRIVAQRPGLIMQRQTWGNRRLLAQIRPFKFKDLDLSVSELYGVEDAGIFSKDYWHEHDTGFFHTHTELSARTIWSDPHTRKANYGVIVGSKRKTGDKVSAPIDLVEHLRVQHSGPGPGSRNDEQHWHGASMKDHVTREHAGRTVWARHNHPQHAKYLYPPGEEAKLVDVHPAAWPLLNAGGSTAYFALEGLLKNDAILSAGQPVVNAGSVTLWQDAALGWLAEHKLSQFGLTVIVPDSDWAGNDLVSSQAHQLQNALADFGVNSVVAAPPATCGDACGHLDRDIGHGVLLPREDHKQGVDDFLGSGGELNDMITQVPAPVAQEPELLRRRVDQFDRDTAVLNYLRETVADSGRFIGTLDTIGQAVGRKRTAVSGALHSLEDQGLLVREDSQAWMPEQRADRRPMTAVKLAPELVPQRDTMTLGEYQTTNKQS